MKKSSQVIVVILMIIGVVLIVPLALNLKSNPPENVSAAPQEKPLDMVQILETQNLNAAKPQFKLNIQTMQGFNSSPLKIVLIDKKSNEQKMELPINFSQYPNECMSHQNNPDNMDMNLLKWETPWFTDDSIKDVGAVVHPKLSEKYIVKILYTDNTSQTRYISTNPIERVCYQIPKSEKMSPEPDNLNED